MDGKGSWRDNVFVERLWRSVKYEEVYLRAYDSVAEARASLGRYLDFYNRKRPHSSLNARTPDRACFDNLPQAGASTYLQQKPVQTKPATSHRYQAVQTVEHPSRIDLPG